VSSKTAESVLRSVRSLLPDIAAAASLVDRDGVVHSDVITQLHEAGYFALLRPEAFGGLGVDPAVYLTATREIAAACTSTGWLAAWLALNNWGLAVRHPRVLQEIWGDNRQALLCSSYAPTGQLDRVDGGFVLSGRWSRCTGAGHASWLSAAALYVGADGAAQDFMAVLVPADDYIVETTWNGLGLRGIDAQDVIVTDKFVPDHRAFSWLDLRYDNISALQRLPQPTMYTLAGTGPLLGAAQRALSHTFGSDDSTEAITAARCDIELSVLQIARNTGELMACAQAGRDADAELVLRSRRDQVMAAERAARAVQTVLFDPRCTLDPDSVDRIWRDAQTARLHVSSNVAQVLSVVGRHMLGLDVGDLIW